MTPRPSDPLTKSVVGAMIGDELDERIKAAARRGRAAEDYGMYVGLAIAGLMGTAEVVIYTVTSLGLVPSRTDAPFPWITAVLFIGCVLPKTIGRVTTGRVWIILANAVAGWFAKPSTPPVPFDFNKPDTEKDDAPR